MKCNLKILYGLNELGARMMFRLAWVSKPDGHSVKLKEKSVVIYPLISSEDGILFPNRIVNIENVLPKRAMVVIQLCARQRSMKNKGTMDMG